MSTDKRFQQLFQSISKAINSVENPVKEKHVRSTIIGTFQEKGAVTFWVTVVRLQLQDNRIIAWKFCHVLHKVLREGHANCLPQSERHVTLLQNLGKLWVHLKDGYGKLIHDYTRLLITKISFHQRNPRFPGNLQLTSEELDAIGENDINNYFQMSVEMFDYMDDILLLQQSIFNSLDITRTNSMTSSGQCRLAPLIPCIQDSNQLYDFSVKLLFKLHSMLPSDTLSGHRERFLKQFNSLKKFYQTTNSMQYFKNLITIPSMPDNAPNFLIQSELRSYIPPVVILPPEESFNEEITATLVDMSEPSSQAASPDSTDLVDIASNQGSSVTDCIMERDKLIEHLQTELSKMRNEIQGMVMEHRATLSSCSDRISSLETQLTEAKADLQSEQEERIRLFNIQKEMSNAPEHEQKIAAAEEKFSILEEKFNKLKTAYTTMRDEHITLIRQKADVDKQFSTLQKSSTGHKIQIENLQQVIDNMNDERKKETEMLLQNANSTTSEIDALKAELCIVAEKLQLEREASNKNTSELQETINKLVTDNETFQKEKQNLTGRLEWCNNEKSIIECELQDLLQQKQHVDETLAHTESELKQTKMALSAEISNAVNARWGLLACSGESSWDIVQSVTHELDNPAISSLQCGFEYLNSLLSLSETTLKSLETVVADFGENKASEKDLANQLMKTSHTISLLVIEGVATSNTSKDMVHGENMSQACKDLISSLSKYISRFNTSVKSMSNDFHSFNKNLLNEVRLAIEKVAKLGAGVGGQDNMATGDSIETELSTMDKAIEEAALQIEEMLKRSRQADSGLKLEVNEKILDACTSLMRAVQVLVKKSRDLQAEIVALGRGTNTAKEFYKRNHQWTEGLISAAKAVAMGAKLLLTSADKLVTSGGKLEQVMVASQEIAASTAQLVVASRVRAVRGSQPLEALTVASRAVSSATGAVIAAAKTCAQILEESEDLDVGTMSLAAGRRLEMESRVRVLELEQALATERLKLAALRRTNYRLADSEIEARGSNGN